MIPLKRKQRRNPGLGRGLGFCMCLAHFKEAQFGLLFTCAIKIFRKWGGNESHSRAPRRGLSAYLNSYK